MDITEVWEEEPDDDGKEYEEATEAAEVEDDLCRQYSVCVLYVVEVSRSKTIWNNEPALKGQFCKKALHFKIIFNSFSFVKI